MNINTNMPAIKAHNNLKRLNDPKSASANRLASGYRVNTAADDAASLAISEKMRTQIRGLEKGTNNIEDSINLFNTGDGSLQEIDNIIVRIKELAVQACNDTNSDSDRQKLDEEMQQLLKNIDSIMEKTEFNEKAILKAAEPIKRIETQITFETETVIETVIETVVESVIETEIVTVNANVSKQLLDSTQAKTTLATLNYPTTSGSLPGIGSATSDPFYVYTEYGISTPSGAVYLNTDVGYWVNKLWDEDPTTVGTFKQFTIDMYKPDGTVSDQDAANFVDFMIKAVNKGLQEAVGSPANLPELVSGFISGTGTANDGKIYLCFSDSNYKITSMFCGGNGSYSFGHTFSHMMFDVGTVADIPIEREVEKIIQREVEVEVEHVFTIAKENHVEVNEYPPKSMWIQTGANALEGGVYTWNTLCVDQLGLVDSHLNPLEEAIKTLEKIDYASEYSSKIRSEFGAFINGLESALQNNTVTTINSKDSESRIKDADMAKEMMNVIKLNILEQAATSMILQSNQRPQMVLQLLK